VKVPEIGIAAGAAGQAKNVFCGFALSANSAQTEK